MSASSRLRREAYVIVDALITDLTHMPGGYRFWTGLPTSGRHSPHSARHRCVKLLLSCWLPLSLKRAMVQACLSGDGVPTAQGTLLYTWLLHNVYNGQEKQLYTEWLQLQTLRIDKD